MPTNFEKTTLAGSPYFDDFDSTKNYLKLIFNPARPVQARELTQIQSVLQNQISSFAKNIFKEGSPVVGATIKTTFDNIAITVDSTDLVQSDDTTAAVYSDFQDLHIRDYDTNTFINKNGLGKIVFIEPNVATNQHRFHILNRGGEYSAGHYILTEDYDDDGNGVISGTDVHVTHYQTKTTGTGILSTNKVIKATIEIGVVFIGGKFIEILSGQEIFVNTASNTGNYEIGLILNESIVDYFEDGSLRDPANNSTNFGAPGADRYKVSVTLTSYKDTDVKPSNFFKMVVIENGQIKSAINKPQYSEILNILAERTFDESGNYTVDPFSLTVKDNDNTTFYYDISPGKAFVQGFEFTKLLETKILASKARTVDSHNNKSFNVPLYGTFVDVSLNVSAGTFPDPYLRPTLRLMDGLTGTGNQVGSYVILLSIKRNQDGTFRFYLGDSLSLRGDLEIAKSIGYFNSPTDTTLHVSFDIVSFVQNNQSLTTASVVEIPDTTIQRVIAGNYTFDRLYTGQTTASTYDIVSGSVTTTANSSPVIIIRDVSGNDITNTATVGISGSTINLSGLTSGPWTVLTRWDESLKSTMVKTLTKTTENFSGVSSKTFANYDVSEVIEIFDTTSDPTKTRNLVLENNNFLFDNGQQDFYYGLGTLSGLDSSKSYEITYYYFSHSGSGDYFTADSYIDPNGYLDSVGGIYGQISTYTDKRNAKTYILSNCLDFRKTKPNMLAGTGIFDAGYGSFVLDYDNYVSRKDIIYIDHNGSFGVVEGVPATNPTFPPLPKNSMLLFQTEVPAFTFDNIDIIKTVINNKNYRMIDIHDLETRINDLEYYSTLNLLKQESTSLGITNTNGTNRIRRGEFVDPFYNHQFGNVYDSEYRCVMDKENGMLMCPFETNSTDFGVDSSTDIAINTNTITLNFTPTIWQKQPKATDVRNINPFTVEFWSGIITIDPSSDNWKETKILPDVNVGTNAGLQAQLEQEVRRKNASSSVSWGDWRTTWTGSRVTSQNVRNVSIPGHNGNTNRNQGQMLRTAYLRNPNGSLSHRLWGEIHRVGSMTTTTTTNQSRSGTKTSYRLQPSTNTKNLGQKVVGTENISFMRPKTINIDIRGMKRLTNLTAYFGEENITPNITENITNVVGVIKTDDNGSFQGKFDLPSGKYHTGIKVLEFTDNKTKPTTSAKTTFTSSGVLESLQSTIISLDAPKIISTQSSTSDTRSSSSNSTQKINEFVSYYDPIAQTFLVDTDTKTGLFLNSIDVFFRQKDSIEPVSLVIVTTDNGYPSQHAVPYSEVLLSPVDVNLSTYDIDLNIFKDGNGNTISGITDFVPTTFTFSDPVYLMEGVEYAFVLKSNSDNYRVYVSKIGDTDIISQKTVDKQPVLGSYFKSQNASTWNAEQNIDIKYNLNRCQFNPLLGTVNLKTNQLANAYDSTKLLGGGSGTEYVIGDEIIYQYPSITSDYGHYQCLVNSPTSAPTIEGYSDLQWTYLKQGNHKSSLLHFNIDTMELSNTTIAKSYRFGVDTMSIFNNNEDIFLNSSKNIILSDNPGNDTMFVQLNLTSLSDMVSPVVSKTRNSVLNIHNLVKDVIGETYKDSGKYISQLHTLRTPANQLRIFADVYRSSSLSQCDVEFFYKTTINNRKFVPLESGSHDVFDSFKDNFVYIYEFTQDLTPTAPKTFVGGWTFKTIAVLDGFDKTVSPVRVFLSSINDASIFDGSALGLNQHFLITTEPDILSSEIYLDTTSGAGFLMGEYVLDSTGNLYTPSTGTVTSRPSTVASDWTEIGSFFLDTTITDQSVDWQTTSRVDTVPSDFDLTSDWVEYELEPDIIPAEAFDTLTVKIEMRSVDDIDIPFVKRLRVIAVK